MPTRFRRYRRGARRSSTYKRKAWRRFTRIYKRYRKPRIHSFKRTCMLTPITLGNTPLNGQFQFQLTDLPDNDEFTSLFDSFRINAVKLQIVPNFTSSPATAQVTSLGLHSIHSIIDHNDSTPITSVLDLMQYDTYKRTRTHLGLKRYFKVSTVGFVGTGAQNVQYGRWVDTTQAASAVFYGFKYIMDALEIDTTVTFDVFATYYIQCKDVR